MVDLGARLETALAHRCRIERKIGSGGMCVVYLARDVQRGHHVALKVLRPELAATLGPKRFLREIKLAAALDHPHVLPLHDPGEVDGLLFYFMPYVEGGSLRQRLERERRLLVGDALRIVRDTADALDYAHRHNVVHRDIKPENILLRAGEALVSDFGLARAISAAVDERLSPSGIAVGTPEYMSPEQGCSAPQIDGRSDIYSLGCVLYEMLAGERPFTGSSAQAIIARHLKEPPRSVRVIRPDVPERVERAVFAALAKEPRDRPATGARFVELLTGAEARRIMDVERKESAL